MPAHGQPLARVLCIPTCSCKRDNSLGWSDAILQFCAAFRAGHCHTKRSKQVTKTVCTDKARHLTITTTPTKTPFGNKLHCTLKGRQHLFKISSPFQSLLNRAAKNLSSSPIIPLCCCCNKRRESHDRNNKSTCISNGSNSRR